MTVADNIETLPQSRTGDYEVARFNALRHGVLSQYTVLPWEDRNEYRALLEALIAEHHLAQAAPATGGTRRPSSRA